MISYRPLIGFLAYHNISYKELAEKTGVPYSTILRIKANKEISWDSLGKICECLGLNVKDAVVYEED